MSEERIRIDLDEVYRIAERACRTGGFSAAHAGAISRTVRAAERDEAVSHGLFRVPFYYDPVAAPPPRRILLQARFAAAGAEQSLTGRDRRQNDEDGDQMKIEIANCNNIAEGAIEIEPGCLNICFALNGSGKSTIATAVESRRD